MRRRASAGCLDKWRIDEAGGLSCLPNPPATSRAPEFQVELEAAIARGFEVVDRPAIRPSQAALLRKKTA
jgi:hypothetical protein